MKKVLIVATVILAICACSKNSNIDPIANAKTASDERDLQQKNFTAPCRPAAFAPGILTYQTVYRFEGANTTRTTRYFKTPDCTSDSDIVLTESGDFNLHKDQQTSDGGKAIDIDYKSLMVTTVTPQGVSAANAIQLCNANDWSANSKRDESTRAANVNCLGMPVPRHNSNIYRVDASVLYLGLNADKSTDPTTRPTALDMSLIYKVQ